MKNKIRLLAVSICCLFCCAILAGCGGQFQEACGLGAGTALPEEQQLGLESPSEKADVTFYGQLPPVPEGLPVLTIQEALKGAGFGADLGAEKFLDIKCRMAGLKPDAVVLVATIRALKYNGGVPKAELSEENIDALKKGIVNLGKHIENIKKFGFHPVVTLNRFVSDTDEEIAVVREFCREKDCRMTVSEVWAKGGEGGKELADAVLEEIAENRSAYHPVYELKSSLREKIETIAKEIYGADGVEYSPEAAKAFREAEEAGYGEMPVCMAKTQYSLSDDASKLGRPEGFTVSIREAYVSAGAGFVVAIAGSIMTMPGLPKVPAAERIGIDEEGNTVGLF